MKQTVIALVGLLLLFGLAACSNKPSTEQTLGGLSIPTLSHNFGEIIRGDKVKTSFTLENVGSKPIQILDTKASCGCTAAVVADSTIQPGQSSEITVTFDSRGRQGDQHKTVLVTTDDPVQQQVTFTITGTVIVDLDFDKPVVRFQPIRRGETQIRTMPIIIRKPEGVTLGEPQIDLPDLTARVITETDDKGVSHPSLELTYTPTEIGFKRGTVRLSTGDARRPELSLSISSKVDGEISIMPARATLWRGQSELAPTIVRLVAIDVPFNILSITDPKGFITTKQTPFKEEKGWEVEVMLAPDKRDADKSFNTELVVTTDHPTMKSFPIPVSYSANERRLTPARDKSARPTMHKAPLQLQVTPPAKKAE